MNTLENPVILHHCLDKYLHPVEKNILSLCSKELNSSLGNPTIKLNKEALLAYAAELDDISIIS
jgi:hypothetical protein